MLGSALLWLAALAVVFATRSRGSAVIAGQLVR
jgi:hypothetical protein